MEFIRKKDPHGYFIVYLKGEVRDELNKFAVSIEEYGECIIVKTRSRRIALSIINKFKDYLCLE